MLKCSIILVAFLVHNGLLRAEDPAPKRPNSISLDDTLPYGQKPIDYFGQETHNSVAELQTRLGHKEARLDAKPKLGYLASLLTELDLPVDSQVLVFSKTALNPKLVSPKTPRAVYFNEECYIGWVPGAASLEIAAVDPQKGWMFYTLSQNETREGVPAFQRESQCLACHAGQSAMRVPGGLVRAFVPDEAGNPLSGYSRVTHEMPFEQRFGGWYVTGSHGKLSHRGNKIDSKTGLANKLLPMPNNVKVLADVLDATLYLSAHSDLVAQMLLHHQVHGQNLMIRVNYEARLGKRSNAEDLLARYLLFADEAPLTEPVQGSTGFAQWFEKRGRKDSQGRSLREWDLKTRLFKYRLSYLIDTPLFDGLPTEARQRIYEKLWDTLSATNPQPGFGHIPIEERRAILEIVSQLKDDLPPQWAKLKTRAAVRSAPSGRQD
jgi:hypothetical protein